MNEENIQQLVQDFTKDIINGAMTKYNVSYQEVDEAMQEIGLWDKLRNYEVALVGMHYGEEEPIEWIGQYLRNKKRGGLNARRQ